MVNEEYAIRLATKKDIKYIAKVSAECFPFDYRKGNSKTPDLKIAQDWISKRFNLYPYSVIIVATPSSQPSKVVGFAIYMLIGGLSGVVQLEILGVSGKYRRKGIASKLMSEAEPIINKHLKKNFSKSVYKFILTTSADNPQSHTVYKKQGFKKTGTLGKLYWGTEEVLYTKKHKEKV